MPWSPVATYCMQGLPYIGVYGFLYRDILEFAHKYQQNHCAFGIFGLSNAEHQKTHGQSCFFVFLICLRLWQAFGLATTKSFNLHTQTKTNMFFFFFGMFGLSNTENQKTHG